MLMDTLGICSLESLFAEVREMIPFGKQASQGPKNVGFCLTTRNPPIAQVELIYGH